MCGITPAVDWPDMELLKSLGVRWIRLGMDFPYTEERGKVSKKFSEYIDYLLRWRDEGFKVMVGTPGPGSYRYEEASHSTVWSSWLPSWMGNYNEDTFYKCLEEGMEHASSLIADLAEWYQIANEPDIDIFKGPLSDEQMDRFLLASAVGVKKGSPRAHLGINVGFLTKSTELLLKRLYSTSIEGRIFDYLGLDGYFGSWQPGGPTDWTRYIDASHALTHVPIIINEWGYSSLQTAPFARDFDRQERYNQDVCRNKSWPRAWKKEHTCDEQAEYVMECLQVFADHPAVIGNYFFRWGDTQTCWQCGEPDCPAECAWGVVDVNGKPKPAYYALREGLESIFQCKTTKSISAWHIEDDGGDDGGKRE